MENYDVLSRLGAGSYGAAWLVCDKRAPAIRYGDVGYSYGCWKLIDIAADDDDIAAAAADDDDARLWLVPRHT